MTPPATQFRYALHLAPPPESDLWRFGCDVTGRDAAAKIWYRALTTYMTSTTNYKGARDAMIRAATDLYGATSTQTSGGVTWRAPPNTSCQYTWS